MTQSDKKAYMKQVATAGADLGEYLAIHVPKSPAGTIHAAAVGYVNRLPLNDIAFEAELVREFEAQAIMSGRDVHYGRTQVVPEAEASCTCVGEHDGHCAFAPALSGLEVS